MVETVSAEPQKRLFIELLTRDITLEDAILDLIDNSINSILVSTDFDILTHFDDTVSDAYDFKPFSNFEIKIGFSENAFWLEDNCGGISFQSAKTTVFQFGRAGSHEERDTLSLQRKLPSWSNRILAAKFHRTLVLTLRRLKLLADSTAIGQIIPKLWFRPDSSSIFTVALRAASLPTSSGQSGATLRPSAAPR